MKKYGLLLAAWDAARADRWRASLSAIAIVLGVIAICSVLALGEVARTAIIVEIERTSGRAATLEVTTESRQATNDRDRWIETTERLGRLDQLADIGPHSAILKVVGQLSLGTGQPSQVDVVGVDPGFASIRRMRILRGRWIREGDVDAGGVVVAINRSASAASTGVPASMALKVDRPVAGTIVGVVDDGVPDPRVYVGWRDLLTWTDRSTANQPLRFLLRVDPEAVASSRQLLQSTLAPAALDDVSIRRIDNVDQVKRVITIAQLSIGAIGLVAIIIGIVGIVNVGLASVRERSRELAVRRSFGASSRDVFQLVLLEAGLVGLVAGIVGVAASMAVTFGAARVLDLSATVADTVRFPVWVALLGVAAGTSASLLGSIVPARRATRLSVIEGIRR